MKLALVDSSAFLALEDRSAREHHRAVKAMQDLVQAGFGLLATNFLFDEAYTLILSRLGRARAVTWGLKLKESTLVQLTRVTEENEDLAWKIILAHEDKDYSYTDATSFAVASSLGIGDVLALDRHFVQFGGFTVRPG